MWTLTFILACQFFFNLEKHKYNQEVGFDKENVTFIYDQNLVFILLVLTYIFK